MGWRQGHSLRTIRFFFVKIPYKDAQIFNFVQGAHIPGARFFLEQNFDFAPCSVVFILKRRNLTEMLTFFPCLSDFNCIIHNLGFLYIIRTSLLKEIKFLLLLSLNIQKSNASNINLTLHYRCSSFQSTLYCIWLFFKYFYWNESKMY
jgi:hypothetical protein